MALKKSYTKAEFEALPETTRRFYIDEKVYVADGENFKLDAEGVEDVTGLKTALQKEREARAQHERDLKAEREKLAGIDIDEYQRLKAEADSKENDDLKAKGKIDELIEKGKLREKQLNETWQTKFDNLTSELNTLRVDHRLRKAFEDGGVISDRIDDAVLHAKQVVKLTERGDLQILDKDGTPLDASIETYAKDLLKEAKPWLYQASGAGGSGAQNGTNGAGGLRTIKRADLPNMAPAATAAAMADVRAGKAQLVD
jgi:hypothetical protein